MQKENKNRDEIINELKEVAPFLSDLKKNSIHLNEGNPDFDTLKQKLNEIPKNETTNKNWKFIPFIKYVSVAVAACFILFVGNNFLVKNHNTELDYQLTTTEIRAYLEDEVEFWENDLLEELALADDLEIDFFEVFDDSQIEEYLEENIEELELEDFYN